MSALGSNWVRTSGTIVGLAMAASAALTVGPLARPAHAAGYTPSLSRFDSRLVADINGARVAHGLRRLVVTAGTTDVAHRWSCHQAAYRTLAHNGSLASQLATHGSSLWTSYAENVGEVATTSGADRLFRAYMNSPEHRANILDPSGRYLGIWSKRGGSLRYNTLDFVGTTSSAYSTSYGGTRVTC